MDDFHGEDEEDAFLGDFVEHDPNKAPQPMEPDDPFTIVLRDLRALLRFGALELPTIEGHAAPEHFQNKALLVTASLLVRGLRGKAAEKWIMKPGGCLAPHHYEVRAALDLVNSGRLIC